LPAEELRVELLGALEVRDGDFDGEEAADGGLVCVLVELALNILRGRVTGAAMIAFGTVIVLVS
jgi:hypothetical protein